MITVTVYRQAQSETSDQVVTDLANLQAQYPHQLAVVDVDSEPTLREQFGAALPVVQAGPYRLRWPFTVQELSVALGAAIDRSQQLQNLGDEKHLKRIERGHTVSGTDRFSIWFSHNYMWLINLFLLLYVGLPFLAPVLANAGAELPARIIYTIYKPLCHQLAFRSWFLYGEQTAYPLELAQVPNLIPYEQVVPADFQTVTGARNFIGNDALGYKVALCERDVASWGVMLLFGVLFAATGRRMRAIPWYVWVVIGIAPIGLDGTSQLPALMGLGLDWLPIRESTPLLRSITGALFGLTTAWFLFPMIEQSMRETRAFMTTKVTVVDQLNRSKR
jgi:uncharacterized membrane protein